MNLTEPASSSAATLPPSLLTNASGTARTKPQSATMASGGGRGCTPETCRGRGRGPRRERRSESSEGRGELWERVAGGDVVES